MTRSHWRSLWWLLAALAGAGLAARLGMWQLDRAAQKRALQAAIEAQAALAPLPAASLPAAAADLLAGLHRRVVLQGHWLRGRTLYLDNRQMRGRPGFFVVTPLRLEIGDAVLVLRGWVPRDPVDRSRLPDTDRALPQGTVQLVGRIAPPPSRLLALADDGLGPIRQNLDPDAYSREIGVALRPLSVWQLDTEPGGPADGLLRDWPAPALDLQKHHGYAFQWFALSALIAGLYVWFQFLRPRLAQRPR